MDDQELKEYRDPLTEQLNELTKQGYETQFKLEEGRLHANDKTFSSDDLIINEEYRFEGESNPDDMSILYAVEASDGTKGTIIDAYGTYSDNELGEFMKGVKEKDQ